MMSRKRRRRIELQAGWVVGLALAACPAMAQTRELPAFDVASVKVSDQPIFMTAPQRSAGRFRWTTDLQYLIAYAYNVSRSRLSGPAPGSAYLYEIDATMPPDTPDDRVRLMVQSLLAVRFKLASHREAKVADGYALVVNKGGLKVKEAKDGEAPPPMPPWMGKVEEAGLDGRMVAHGQADGVTAVTGRRVTMAQLAAELELLLGRFVTDQTALSGRYYFGFQCTLPDQPDATGAPSVFTVLQDVGLKLEKRKGPVEMFVVDHVEITPTEN